jgi:CRISPR system Cascade subunit CasA
MTQKFNLISEPWIPVIYVDGSTRAVGWRDLIADSKLIADIQTDPVHIYGVVVRFATALTLRTQGAPLDNPSPTAWQKWGEMRLSEGVDETVLDTYLDKWFNRFWLVDDNHPFLQDPSIATECVERASTNKLFFDVASGNNHLWWTKIPDSEAAEIPFAVAAMALLGQWGYAAGGRCTARKGISDGKQAPLRRFTQFIPRGATLLETLLMCCTPAASDHELAEKDAPVWEIEPSATPVPGQLGRLTASTRGLLLFPGNEGIKEVVNTWGSGNIGEDFWSADVFMAKRVGEQGISPVRMSQSDVTWREVPSILSNQNKVDAQLFPVALDALRNPLGSTDVFVRSGVTVLTHFADKSKDLGWGRSELPEILAAGPQKDPVTFSRLSEFCKISGEIIPKVRLAIQKSGSDSGPQTLVVPDLELFVKRLWLDAEGEFYSVLKGEMWEDAACRLMRHCVDQFDTVTEGVEAPGRLAAIIQCRRSLNRKLDGIKRRYGLDTKQSEVV